MTGHVRKAKLEDAVYLSEHMRPEDIKEIKISHNVKPLEGLLSSFQLKNTKVFAIIGTNKECVAMFGISDCPFVNVLNEEYKIIYNWVHPDNWKTLKWLQFCGFQPKTKHKYGVNNEEFLLVLREKHV